MQTKYFVQKTARNIVIFRAVKKFRQVQLHAVSEEAGKPCGNAGEEGYEEHADGKRSHIGQNGHGVSFHGNARYS